MCKRIVPLKAMRMTAGLSEGDLATKMGVTKSAVLECGIDELFEGW